jgi:hypothetical protein
MKNKKKNTRANVINYMTKEDGDPYVLGFDLQNWMYTCKEHRKFIARDLISERISLPQAVEYDPLLVFNYGRLKNNINMYKMDTVPLENKHRTQKNLWIYGKPGCGKTYYVTTTYTPYYWKNQSKWWDGYVSQPNVILDDLDNPSMEFAHYLKIWSDNYGNYAEVKNGHVVLRYERFIVTSNYKPDELYKGDQ